jgi:hypothetical protein
MTSGHSLSGRGPEYFSISFIQGRPVQLLRNTTETARVLQTAGFQECPLDYFYDVQVGRRKHVARLKLPDVRLTLPSAGHGKTLIATGTLHVLVWSVGFMVFRLTFTDRGMERPDQGFRAWFKAMHGLEHDWPVDPHSKANAQWMTQMAGAQLHATGGVRRFFDVAGYAMHEILRGRPLHADTLTAWACSSETALDHAEELVRRGELRYPYPVTFGSHSELIWVSSRTLPNDPDEWISDLIGSGAEGELLAANVDEHLDRKWWYISEFQSILVNIADSLPASDQVYDVSRAQMIEYITYRRAGLMAIQRETEQITAERLPVEGARVADWMWLMSALTNDYVLGGWCATMFERFRRRYLNFEGVRNLFSLESQVTSNIEAFQGRLDAGSDRIGVITGVLFGIVAATALVPIGELFVIFFFHLRKNTYANFPDDYPVAFIGIVIGMLALIGLICWRMLRHANSLRPPRARRKGFSLRSRRRRLSSTSGLPSCSTINVWRHPYRRLIRWSLPTQNF